MKKRPNLLFLLGFILILASLALLLFSRFYAGHAKSGAENLTNQIESLLPPRTPGVPEEYTNPDMPVLQVEGQDFVALVDFPAYGVTLPVGSVWKAQTIYSYPCRFSGSVYSDTLVIGGMDQPGQFDFFTRMDQGDKICVTDMIGREFSFIVDRIDRSGSAEADRLDTDAYALEIFVRDAYSMDYIILRCSHGS